MFVSGNPDIIGIRDLRVESKIKSTTPLGEEETAHHRQAPPIVFMFDATEEPLYRGGRRCRGGAK